MSKFTFQSWEVVINSQEITTIKAKPRTLRWEDSGYTLRERCHPSEAWIYANVILFEKIFHWGSHHRCSLPEELIPPNEPGGGKQRSIQLYSEVPGYIFIVKRTRLFMWFWFCRHGNCNSDGVFKTWTKNLETSEVEDICQGCISSVTLWRGHCTKMKVKLKEQYEPSVSHISVSSFEMICVCQISLLYDRIWNCGVHAIYPK